MATGDMGTGFHELLYFLGAWDFLCLSNFPTVFSNVFESFNNFLNKREDQALASCSSWNLSIKVSNDLFHYKMQ